MKRLSLALAAAFLFAGYLRTAAPGDSRSRFAAGLTATSARAKNDEGIPVRGCIYLNASGKTLPGGGFTCVMLRGWGTFRDESAKIVSKQVDLVEHALILIDPYQPIYHTCNLSVSVPFYNSGGKLVGKTTLTGQARLAGCDEGGTFHLSGYGLLTGRLEFEHVN